MRVLERLGKMFGAAEDRARLAKDAQKKYKDKNTPVTKPFSAGDMIFLDHP